jgi:uncharacterized protein (DUF433 family)
VICAIYYIVYWEPSPGRRRSGEQPARTCLCLPLVPPVSSLKMRVMSEPLIVVDPEIMNGTPCFRGTRVPFKNLIDYLEGGHSLDEFLRQFPTVTREMAVRALEEAKDSLLARIA